jgi:FkbM family methyltransferase
MSTFLSSLKKSGHLDQIHVTLCNVGSRKLGLHDDYASQGWGIFAPHLTIYGFDADADACEAANADLESRQVDWTERHVPLALGNSTGESTLYVTQHPMCTSLYPPNESFLARFEGLSSVMNLDFTIEIETTTLDDFCQQENLKEVDFLQIDVQGADLQVLEGAAHLLEQSVLGIQIEVEPSHLYINQPLFADVDTYLRQQGFTLFDVTFARRVRARSPITSTLHPGQIVWGDAYYLYDLLREDISLNRPKTPEKLFKLACVADAMNFSDYTLELLEYLTLNYGSDPAYNFADNIVECLAQFPELVEQGLKSLPVVANLWSYVSQETSQSILN